MTFNDELIGITDGFPMFRSSHVAIQSVRQQLADIFECRPHRGPHIEGLEARRLLSVTLPDDVNSVAAIAQNLGWFTDLNGTLLFVHNDGFHGPELYRSNGDAATTT